MGKCYIAYQERSSKRSIQHLLDKWGLVAEWISGRSFGFIDGDCDRGHAGFEEEGITLEGTGGNSERLSWGSGINSIFTFSLRLGRISS
jgi:hypothetical protein